MIIQYFKKHKLIIGLILGLIFMSVPIIGSYQISSSEPGAFSKNVRESDSLLMWIIFDLAVLPYFGLLLLNTFGLPVGMAMMLYSAILLLSVRYPDSKYLGNKTPQSAIIFVILGNIYMAFQPLVFLSCPNGIAIRPMFWTSLMFAIGLIITILCFQRVETYIKPTQNNHLRTKGILLSLWPIPAFLASLWLVMGLKGLTLAP